MARSGKKTLRRYSWWFLFVSATHFDYSKKYLKSLSALCGSFSALDDVGVFKPISLR
ncbi:hypothetical protein ATPR_0929 [Acetobacter tropicalis NBRC 101654]|uniref:Uncharacterized protein n=1 Tax=Acetobacter tropicalis NBRC 101654 TaxID=749388 RepID=F7VC30_9PROT|nr:hypothetical protein ATPR_0929 [Acetobacter tropicalis NBRC 101654]